MSNIFFKEKPHSVFSWDSIGDIKEGRGDLGEEVPVLVYRLMQYTLLDVLSSQFGEAVANGYFRRSGHLAGSEFAAHMLDMDADALTFVSSLRRALSENNAGIMGAANVSPSTGQIELTVGQEMGGALPGIGEGAICSYDDGFISGILEAYSGSKYYGRRAAPADEGQGGQAAGMPSDEMPVLIYRLMQYTMLDVLTREFGEGQANEYFRQAGFIAGEQFAMDALDLSADINNFVAGLQKALQENKIGIMRMEEFDAGTGELTLTVGQDLDCSGLPITNETVCSYDEGFIAGIMGAYTGKNYTVRETDCWANGDRVCRFKGSIEA